MFIHEFRNRNCRRSALGWVTDFLSDRSQTVRSGKANSGDAMLQFCVPQGPLLGSVIFVLTYFLVLVLVAVFEIFFSFSFLVFIIFSF